MVLSWSVNKKCVWKWWKVPNFWSKFLKLQFGHCNLRHDHQLLAWCTSTVWSWQWEWCMNFLNQTCHFCQVPNLRPHWRWKLALSLIIIDQLFCFISSVTFNPDCRYIVTVLFQTFYDLLRTMNKFKQEKRSGKSSSGPTKQKAEKKTGDKKKTKKQKKKKCVLM